MATKTQVIRLLNKQGAEYEIEKLDPYTFSAWLPEHLIWDNSHKTGMVTEEFDPYEETKSEYWDYILNQINYDVVAKP